MTEDPIDYGSETAHWMCDCGQPNSKDRDECVNCGETPQIKQFRKKLESDGTRGRKRTEYY